MTNKVRGDQETSASVNRFKVRNRERVTPGVLSRKSSSVSSSKDESSSGYKVRTLNALNRIYFVDFAIAVVLTTGTILSAGVDRRETRSSMG